MSSWNTNGPPVLAGGRYRVEAIFADSGGMGVIYDAVDLRCKNNRVLIKTTRYDGGSNARHFVYGADEAIRHVERLRSILEWERKLLIRFKKEGINNIPSIIDFFYDRSLLLQATYEGRRGAFSVGEALLSREPFLVMERVHGDTLEHVMTSEEFAPQRELRLLRLARELLTVFIRMHRKFEVSGKEAFFIYQDLKPANVLVGKADYFTLIDLGGVTLRLGDKTTEPTAGMLTYGYAAPEGEIDNGVRIDQRFDLYTLGATLYHGLTGIDPRDLPGQYPVLDLEQLRKAAVSEGTRRIIAKALERDPERRYTIAAEMRKDVLNALRDLGDIV